MIGTYSRIGGNCKSAYRRLVVCALALAATALVPASALAASDPTEDQYSSTLQLVSQGGGGGGTASGVGEVGGLPFTGFDVAALAAVGLAICAAGLLLRRRAHREHAEGIA